MTKRTLNNHKITSDLNEISLICSLYAINLSNYSYQGSIKKVGDDQNLDFIFHSTNLLYCYLPLICSNNSLLIINSYILQNLNILSTFYNIKVKTKNKYSENERVKQYLRKFAYFYQYYYQKYYPNDLSTLSIKKVNMLAIRNLFFIHSL